MLAVVDMHDSLPSCGRRIPRAWRVQRRWGALHGFCGPDAGPGWAPFWHARADRVLLGMADLPVPALVPAHPPRSTLSEDLGRLGSAWMRGCGAWYDGDMLVLFSGPSGTCRMFFTVQDDAVVFGTAAALLTRGVLRAPDVIDAASGRVLPACDETVFPDVRAVDAGAVVMFRWHDGALVQETRGRLDPSDPGASFDAPAGRRVATPAQAVAQVREVLLGEVARMIHGHERVGVLPGDGLGTAAVAAAARRLGANVSMCTVSSPHGSEHERMAEVAHTIGARHLRLHLSHQDLADLLPGLIRALETWDPVTLQIAAPAFHACQALRGRAAVVLAGHGAELLLSGAAAVGTPDERNEDRIWRRTRARMRLAIPTNEMSPALGSRWGLTVRYPFWSEDMRALALAMPARCKAHGNIEAYPLREAMAPMLPASAAWGPAQPTHEVLRMQRMFADLLGCDDPADQAACLRRVAERALLDPDDDSAATWPAAHEARAWS